MEGRSVLLAKLPFEIKEPGIQNILLSPSLKHILYVQDNQVTLYSLSKQTDYEHRAALSIWTNIFLKVECVIFSDDGKSFAILAKTHGRKINIYNITEDAILNECEAYLGELEQPINDTRASENVCDFSASILESGKLVHLHKNEVVLYICGLLCGFIASNSECQQIFSVSVVYDVKSYHFNDKFFYCLDGSGIVYIYALENGNLVSIYDMYEDLPKSLNFFQLYVNTFGTQMALLGNSNQIFIFNIPSVRVTALSTPQHLSVGDSSASVSSFKTTNSKTSTYSRVDSLRREATNKKIASIVNASTASSSWLSYLDKLTTRKKIKKGNIEECGGFVCIQDLPNNYIIRSLHFCQESLGVWATLTDGAPDGFYRLYDKSTGQLDSADILAPDTQIVPLDTAYVSLDLFSQALNLWLPLGIISRDILIQKMVGGENHNLVSKMIGDAVLPLPLLQEGLTHLQLDLVRLALNLHTQGFKSKISDENVVVNELLESTKQLFQTVYAAVKEHNSNEQWSLQVRRIALTHANTLLSLLRSPSTQKMLQIEILENVVLLRRGESLLSVDLPVIPQWNAWLCLSDEEILLKREISLPLVLCFLELYRGWTIEEINGRRFYNIVQHLFINLLQKRELEHATTFISNVKLDPEKEVESLYLKCRDPSLRDYLITSFSNKVKEEHYDAWKFLCIVESVLNQYFPKFSKSPLKISDVLSFSSNDKALILADLYFSTHDINLKPYLEKYACWDCLLSYSSTEGILAWIDPERADPDSGWPLDLFSQWNIDHTMVDSVLSSDSTDLNKYLIWNKFALLGVFTSVEKSNLEKLMLRMAFSELFPNVENILKLKTANLSFPEFSNMMFQHAIKNCSLELAVKYNLNEGNTRGDDPDWLKLHTLHIKAGETMNHLDIAEAISATTDYLASYESVELCLYLKQHPMVAVVTDILKNKNICQLHSHVSPLLAAALPVSPSAQEDITVYSILSHTVPFHIENIFQHQINKKKSSLLPDFSSEHLSMRYGLDCSLGYEEFLKQGRPASAVSFIFLKGKSSLRKKTAVNRAHGLALANAHSTMVASSCVAFVELLGEDSSLIRAHIAIARTLKGYLSETVLEENLLHLCQRREDCASKLLMELESYLRKKWTADNTSMNAILKDFHLVVRLAVCHSLPPPTALFEHSLETNNWLLFIVASQLFQYPLSTVQEICSKCRKHNIRKHLYYALQSNSSRNQTENVVKLFEPETDLFACLSHHGSNANALFDLSRKLNSPVLALVGSSLQPLDVESGLCSWFVASLDPEAASECPLPPWTEDSVTQLLEHIVKCGYFYTLSQGFSIFHPDNPFRALANFFIDSICLKKFHNSFLNIKLFIAVYLNLSNESNQESSFLMNKNWVAKTAYRMTCSALTYCFHSDYLRRCFLKTLVMAQFSDVVQDTERLFLLLQLSECLADSPFNLDWKRLCLHQDFSQLSEILSSLTEQHMFDTAYKFAHIADLPVDNILVTQWSILTHTDEHKESGFWQRCEAAFQEATISPQVAICFYRNQAASSNDLQERYILLRYALRWMNKISPSEENITSLQLELYTTCLQEDFKLEVITEGVLPMPLRCLSNKLIVSPMQSRVQLSSSQSHRLDAVIHQMLVMGDIRTAFLLQALFHHTNQDCELLLACMRLAEGIMTVSQLPPRIQEHLAEDPVRRPRITFVSSVPKMQSHSNILQSENQSILNALYTLQAHQTCTTALFGNIICGFKISVALNCDYKDIIMDNEPLKQLHPQNSFDVATCLLNLADLNRPELTHYVCSQIITVLNSEPVNGKYVLWSCDLETEFSCILDLSGSALMLGNLLLGSDSILSSSSKPTNYKKAVELLILAHNCFTKVCHMEGIASVLTLSRSLANQLLDCGQWPLMVRLLTGIGRYTEMNYIFQILKDNYQFEYLLRKGFDKPQLMSATLEFVRHDKALFSLVTHHFSMYSELATLYEEEARVELGKMELVENQLSVSNNNKACLQIAMSKYSDATEHYMQAKKMKCGVSSIQQAELVAIQLSLLANTTATTVPCLINLNQNQAIELINHVISCEQAHIVANAYNLSVDWSAALYHNCVVKGDTVYLNTWTRHHQLNNTVVQDVVRRFQNEKEISSTMEVNMRWFVSSVSLLDVKYRVASQLGFKDILQHLLSTPDMAYLKDTVWQRGYKKQLI